MTFYCYDKYTFLIVYYVFKTKKNNNPLYWICVYILKKKNTEDINIITVIK